MFSDTGSKEVYLPCTPSQEATGGSVPPAGRSNPRKTTWKSEDRNSNTGERKGVFPESSGKADSWRIGLESAVQTAAPEMAPRKQ